MTTFRTLVFGLAAALGMLGAEPPASAVTAAQPAISEVVLHAAADCYSVGQRVASEEGGRLKRADQVTRGGRTYCVIVVLVPAQDGNRGRRVERVVPAD